MKNVTNYVIQPMPYAKMSAPFNSGKILNCALRITRFSNDLTNCPCGTGCPLGCPCDFYDCDGKWPPHTTPQPTTPGVTQTTRADPSKVIPYLVTNRNGFISP